jgi:hypothetical protein
LNDLRKLLVSIVGHEPDDEQGGSARFAIGSVVFDGKISSELERIGFTGSVTFDGETQGYPIENWSYEDGQRTEVEVEEEDPYYAEKDYTFTPDDPSRLKTLHGSLVLILLYGVDGIQDGAIPASGIQGYKFDNSEWGRGEVSEELERLKFSGTVTVHGDPVEHWMYESGKKVDAENPTRKKGVITTKKKATRKKATRKKARR